MVVQGHHRVDEKNKSTTTNQHNRTHCNTGTEGDKDHCVIIHLHYHLTFLIARACETLHLKHVATGGSNHAPIMMLSRASPVIEEEQRRKRDRVLSIRVDSDPLCV